MATEFRIPRCVEDCNTLAEYRDFILRLSQAEVAARIDRQQAWISQIENGHLPRPKFWPLLLKAYAHNDQVLSEDVFFRLFRGGFKASGGAKNGNAGDVAAKAIGVPASQ